MSSPELACFLKLPSTSDLDSQAIARLDRFSRPKLPCFSFKIDSIPLWVEMRQYEFLGLRQFGNAYRLLQFQVRRDRFVPIERTFENQEISTARELRNFLS